MTEVTHPIEGDVVLLAGAKASVTLPRLSELLEAVQQHLGGRIGEYDRQFERIEGTDGVVYYLAGAEFWDEVGAELELGKRETDAIRRTHETQFKHDGRRLDRRDEFETSLEIRDVVVLAPGA